MFVFLQKLPLITRAYSLPVSLLSWFVAFAYALKPTGNLVYGLIALMGVCFAHLGVNVFDDLIDYMVLPKVQRDGKTVLLNAQNNKCELILDGTVTTMQTFVIASVLFLVAFLIGMFFTFKVGLLTLLFMSIAGVIGLLYPILGKYRLCEVAVAILYGPLLFGGIYYVMNGVYSFKTLIACIPTMLFTVNLLYTDTMLDFDIDLRQSKKTIANWFKDKLKALIFQRVVILLGYISVYLMYVYKIVGLKVFAVYFTIPFALNLVNGLYLHFTKENYLPKKRFSFIPQAEWDKFVKDGVLPFMFNMYQARNLMVYCSIILGIVLLIR